MIIKNYEINKINIEENKFFLLYGNNDGAKADFLETIFKNKKENIKKYYENEILNNTENFYNSLTTKSFFEEKKIIIIKKTTNKIFDLIKKIIDQKLDDVNIFLDADNLEKKSKLRDFFEKQKKIVCVPFYLDTEQNLNIIARNFFKEKSIELSQQLLNLIIERSNGSRQHLKHELNKIHSLSKTKKKISLDDIVKLTNLGEQNEISEIIDLCLSKNQKKIIRLLNENNFSGEDSIYILRILLNKTKRLLNLTKSINKENDVDSLISNYKPPIFWKDKDLVKKQINSWKVENVRKLMIKINKIELLVKKTPLHSKNILNDFLIEISI